MSSLAEIIIYAVFVVFVAVSIAVVAFSFGRTYERSERSRDE